MNIQNSFLTATLVGSCNYTFDSAFDDLDCGRIIRSDCSCCEVKPGELCAGTKEYTQILGCEFGVDATNINIEHSNIHGEVFEKYLEL